VYLRVLKYSVVINLPMVLHLHFTQACIEWVAGAPSEGVKRPGRESDHSPPTSAQCRVQDNVGLYIHFPIRLCGVVLN
jgi:hypothetical protein